MRIKDTEELRTMMAWYPLDTLEERFARGEIDETEYRARADVLRAAHH